MTGTLKVSTAKLRSAANQLSSTGTTIDNLTSQMTSTVKGMTTSVWSGDAASAYQQKFDQLQDDIRKMKAMIDEHVKDLNDMADKYEQAEKTSLNLVNSLSGNAIS